MKRWHVYSVVVCFSDHCPTFFASWKSWMPLASARSCCSLLASLSVCSLTQPSSSALSCSWASVFLANSAASFFRNSSYRQAHVSSTAGDNSKSHHFLIYPLLLCTCFLSFFLCQPLLLSNSIIINRLVIGDICTYTDTHTTQTSETASTQTHLLHKLKLGGLMLGLGSL